jgi:hypothetical protein
MTSRAKVHNIDWVRFTKYEIRDGFIRPAAGSPFERYTPWAEFERESGNKAPRPAYIELFDLLRRIGMDYSSGDWDWALTNTERPPSTKRVYRWTPDDGPELFITPRAGICLSPMCAGPSREHGFARHLLPWELRHVYENAPEYRAWVDEITPAVVNWCARFGLLGVLPHASDWSRLRLRYCLGRIPKVEHEGVCYEHVTHARQNGIWETRRWLSFALEEYRGRVGQPAPKYLDKSSGGSGARIQEIDELVVDPDPEAAATSPLSRTWAGFFPDVSYRNADQYAYPCPLTDRFWSEYAEPLDTFLRYALALRQAVEPHFGDVERVVPEDVSMRLLDGLIGPVSQRIRRDPESGDIEPTWVFPSLLSAMSQMAIQDIRGGKRLLNCAECGAPLVTTGYQTRYCTTRCQWRANQRRSREHHSGAAGKD